MATASIDFDIGDGVFRRQRAGGKGRARRLKSGVEPPAPAPGTGGDTAPLLSEGQKANDDANRRAWYVCAAVTCCCIILALLITLIVVATSSGNNGTPSDDDDMGMISTMSTLITTPPPPMATPPMSTGGSTTEAPQTPGTVVAALPLLTIDLSFLCNVPFDNGTCRAIFSYENPNVDPVTIPGGSNNYIEPGPPNRDQRTVFKAGMHFGGATFLWNCEAHAHARWTVRSGASGEASVAMAPPTLVECPPLPIGSSVQQHSLRKRTV